MKPAAHKAGAPSQDDKPKHSQAGWHDEMFASRGWRTALEQFARATGLAVSLLDGDLQLRIGPFIASPVTRLLGAANCWDQKKGSCYQTEVDVARAALEAGSIVHRSENGMFALFALPLYLDRQVLGVVIGGWVFDNFPDPVLADRFAKRIGSAFPEFWQTARQQVPVSKEKLMVYAELLDSLCQSFIHERAENLHQQEQSRELFALNESAKRLAIATSAEEIGAAAVDAVMNLDGADSARLLLRSEVNWSTAASREIVSDTGELSVIEITNAPHPTRS